MATVKETDIGPKPWLAYQLTDGTWLHTAQAVVSDGSDPASVALVNTDNPQPMTNVSRLLFTTNANLAAGAEYDSGILDMRNESQVQTHALASHDGTMTFLFLKDAAGTDTVRTLTIPYTAANGYQLFAAPCFSDYVQYKFLNGATEAQTDFLFETKVTTTAINPQLLRADAFISPSMVSQLNRSVIVGQDSAGTFRNTPTDTEGHLKISVTEPKTAFGDLRVTELSPKIHLTFPYNINADIVTETELNSGTVSQADSMCVLQTSTNSSGEAEMQSRGVLTYRSGLGGLVRFTALFTTGVADSTQLAGVGDSADGFYFGYNGATFGILRIQNSSSTWTAQTAWNVDDLSGNAGTANPSQMTLDQTKINVFQIKYQWLGAGQIEFSVEDSATGLFVPVHRISYANANTVPSIYNATLPLRLFVQNSGNGTNLTLKSASMAGFVEGKSILTGPANSYSAASNHTGTAHIFHIRNKATYISKTNRVRCFLEQLSVGNDANTLVTFKLLRSATLSGTPSWTDVNGNDSVMETDTVQTYSSGGKVLFEGTVGKDTGAVFLLKDLDISVIPGEILTVISTNGGAAQNMQSTLTWREDF